MSKKNMNGQARLFLKQSINNAFYLFYTFSLLSHYCSSYPYIVNSRGFIAVAFVTRTLTCFTELYNNFYENGKKCVPVIKYFIRQFITCLQFKDSVIGFVVMVLLWWYLPTNTKFYSY